MECCVFVVRYPCEHMQRQFAPHPILGGAGLLRSFVCLMGWFIFRFCFLLYSSNILNFIEIRNDFGWFAVVLCQQRGFFLLPQAKAECNPTDTYLHSYAFEFEPLMLLFQSIEQILLVLGWNAFLLGSQNSYDNHTNHYDIFSWVHWQKTPKTYFHIYPYIRALVNKGILTFYHQAECI